MDLKKIEELNNRRTSVEVELFEACAEYILQELGTNGKAIYDRELYNFCVTYDGGRHPECNSNAFSSVYGIYTKGGEIFLIIEDCDSYDANLITAAELCDAACALKYAFVKGRKVEALDTDSEDLYGEFLITEVEDGCRIHISNSIKEMIVRAEDISVID